MTRDDIIRMAREADPGFETDTFHAESLVGMEAIERFAALVAAAEREACAKVCDEEGLHITASIIRARGRE